MKMILLIQQYFFQYLFCGLMIRVLLYIYQYNLFKGNRGGNRTYSQSLWEIRDVSLS